MSQPVFALTTNVASSNNAKARSTRYNMWYSDICQVGGFLRVLWCPPPIKLTATIYTYYIHSVVVQDFVSGWVVMWLVHATGKTWYKVLYHHTMYVISISNISIKTNSKGWIKMCSFCVWRHVIFSVHSPMSGYCVLSHIPMVWRHVKVVRQRTSRAMLHHSFITTLWWYNILYQIGDFS